MLRTIRDESDAEILQNELFHLQEWAVRNNMAFNGTKFQLLRYGTDDKLNKETVYFTPEIENNIDRF